MIPRLPGEATLVASWRALAAISVGATVTEASGSVTAVFPGWTPLNNAIARMPPSTAELERLDAAYRTAGVTEWAYWVPNALPDLSGPDVTKVPGLHRDATTLVMRADLSGHLVSSAGMSATSVRSAAVAGDEPLDAAALEPPDGVEGLGAWVAVRGGAAVAGLWTCLHDRDCGIYAVGTAPAWRRRGIARALVEHALADVHRQGARTASLQSTPMAVPLYASMGFEPVGRYEEWVREAASSSA